MNGPDSLYNSAVSEVVKHYPLYENELKIFHGRIVFDVCYKVSVV